jgi:hypothetical protein
VHMVDLPSASSTSTSTSSSTSFTPANASSHTREMNALKGESKGLSAGQDPLSGMPLMLPLECSGVECTLLYCRVVLNSIVYCLPPIVSEYCIVSYSVLRSSA